MIKVYLCENIHKKAREYLESFATIIDSYDRIGEVDAVINRNLYIDRKFIDDAENLKVIAIHGTGMDGVDEEYAKERGIEIFSTPGANADSVAELAVGLMLNASRNITQADRLIRSGIDYDNSPVSLMGYELTGKTLGLIGTGNIACKIAYILQNGFGMKVIGYSKHFTKEKASEKNIEMCELDEVLKRADYINISVALNDETVNMISRREFELMKESAYIINTARGRVINEDDMYEALLNKKIRGAAGDVFVSEPPKSSDKLISLDNFIATPHIGANTDEALLKVGMKVVEGIRERLLRYEL